MGDGEFKEFLCVALPSTGREEKVQNSDLGYFAPTFPFCIKDLWLMMSILEGCWVLKTYNLRFRADLCIIKQRIREVPLGVSVNQVLRLGR